MAADRAAEFDLRPVVARLEHALPQAAPQAVQDAVNTVHRELATARVQTYLSILVERRAAKTLAALDAATARGTGRRKGTAMTDTFGSWLVQFADSPTPLGDLARLAADDPAWQSEPDRLLTYVAHLEQAGATPAAFQTLTDAWIGYATRPKPEPGSA
ncbi:three-helix bundle dimerization domain-containing protein [Streptomyces erythrochromogenes]|uniref:three-helix bundle dimerization domain-containing protein n=1 Tax=Streptomyces erythrochromogenes TaxID=285574 RepID=UPI0036B1A19E